MTKTRRPYAATIVKIRKRAKRARYASELAASVFGDEADRSADRLEGVQDSLGELQDAVMAEEQLTRLGLHRLDAGAAEEDSRLVGRQRWTSAWRSARAKRLRRWMA